MSMTLPLELLKPYVLNQVYGVLASRGHTEAQSPNWPVTVLAPFHPDAHVLADFVQEHVSIQDLTWRIPQHPEPDDDPMQPIKMWCLWYCLKYRVPRHTEKAQAAMRYLLEPTEYNRRAAHALGNSNPHSTASDIAFLASFHPTPACLIAYPNIVEPILTVGYSGHYREQPHIRLLYYLRNYLPTSYTLD